MVKIYPSETEKRLSPESPAELLLIDPAGKKTGYNPEKKMDLTEMPDSYYDHGYIEDQESGESGPETVELYVPRPLAGDYELQVIGKWKGAYTLSIEASDREMVFSTKDFRNVVIHKGEKHIYKLHFVKEDGRKTEIFGPCLTHSP